MVGMNDGGGGGVVLVIALTEKQLQYLVTVLYHLKLLFISLRCIQDLIIIPAVSRMVVKVVSFRQWRGNRTDTHTHTHTHTHTPCSSQFQCVFMYHFFMFITNMTTNVNCSFQEIISENRRKLKCPLFY